MLKALIQSLKKTFKRGLICPFWDHIGQLSPTVLFQEGFWNVGLYQSCDLNNVLRVLDFKHRGLRRKKENNGEKMKYYQKSL